MIEYCVADVNGKPCQFLAGHVGDCFPINPRTEWAPMPDKPVSEVAPGLWIGSRLHEPAPGEFDAVLTLHAQIKPVTAPTIERRWHILDGDLPDKDELSSSVAWVFHHWEMEQGNVLIRCVGGLNRSGLVAALVLVASVIEPVEAVAMVRRARSPYALCNPTFVEHVLSYGSLHDVF
jgi:predicted protein tyrosine phosphatase